MAARSRSLLRRLLLGFMAVMLGIWLVALARIAWEAQADRHRTTAIVNKGWTRQILLNVASVADQPGQMRQIGAAIETLRLDMFRELGFQNQARTQVWHARVLVYDSDPAARSSGADGADAADWASWTERDARRDVTVKRSEKINDKWMFTPAIC